MSFLAEEIQKLTTLVKQMTGDNHRLTIENGLLRKASEEQRELNGRLRIELRQMDDWALGKTKCPMGGTQS
jgi:regulator of replication initiation timing